MSGARTSGRPHLLGDDRMQRKNSKGFTLVELIIVVLIIALLASVGYPMYTGQVRKTNRLDAQGQMQEFAAQMEQYRSQHFSYEDATMALVPALAANPLYNFALAPAPLDQTYTLTATPVAGTVMDGEGVMIINNQGQTCWVKGAAACDPTDPTQAWGKH